MDVLLAKIEGAPTGVKLLMVLASAQDLMVHEGAAMVSARATAKMELIACVTAWRDAHEGPEWTQATAIVFGEVLKAFDAAVQAVAADAAAAQAVAAEVARDAAAAAVAEAAVVAAQLVGARARVEELEKMNTELSGRNRELEARMAAQEAELKEEARVEELEKMNTELSDRNRELEARMAAQEAELKEEANELKEQNGRLAEQLRDLGETYEANMEAARQGLRQHEAARQAVVRRRVSKDADAAAMAVAQQPQQAEEAEEDEAAEAKDAAVAAVAVAQQAERCAAAAAKTPAVLAAVAVALQAGGGAAVAAAAEAAAVAPPPYEKEEEDVESVHPVAGDCDYDDLADEQAYVAAAAAEEKEPTGGDGAQAHELYLCIEEKGVGYRYSKRMDDRRPDQGWGGGCKYASSIEASSDGEWLTVPFSTHGIDGTGNLYLPVAIQGKARFVLTTNDDPNHGHLWQPVWQPNKDVTKCNLCKATFTLLRRKHHCRECGKIMCNDCSRFPKRRLCKVCWVRWGAALGDD